MNIEATYRPNVFSSVEDMDTAVDNHIYHNTDKLPASNRKILRAIAGHAFTPIGTAHLCISTIAGEVGCSESTVSRAIKRLVELKVIHVKKGTKGNGIQGANYYSILNFSHEVTMQVQEREMTERATHEKPCESKANTQKIESETGISFELGFNPFVVKNVVNNVNACASTTGLKQLLRDIYQPDTVQKNRDFDELCRIGLGRLKQFMRTHQMPYLQMEQVVIRCMQQLTAKEGVRNQFAMYSKMIERQVLQLFEQPISPVIGPNTAQSVQSARTEKLPSWWDKRNEGREQPNIPSTVDAGAVDFEAERQKILAKLGG